MRLLTRQHALAFEGGYIEIGDHEDFALREALTIAAWVRPSSGSGLQATIVSKDYSVYEPQVQSGRFVFESGVEYEGEGARQLGMGEWVHLAITFDAAAPQGNLRLYVNGELDGAFDRRDPLPSGASPLLIGKRDGWDDGLFQGEMAGIAIWRRALSAWQIRQVVNSPVNARDPALVAYWRMDEGEGDTLPDASGNGHHGAFHGALRWRELDAPVRLDRRERQLRPHTSLSRLAPLHEGGTRDLDAAPGGAAPATKAPLPPSGRGGEATAFLNRVRLHNQQRLHDHNAEANDRLQAARAAAAEKRQAAHAAASQTMNSARFDYLYFLHDGKICRVDARARIEELPIRTSMASLYGVDARLHWQGTGLWVSASETVRLRATDGWWHISDVVGHVTAAGAAHLPAKDDYVLPHAPEGALIGRIGATIFLVGEGVTAPAGLEGDLSFICNDDFDAQEGAGFEDNSGTITVEIAIEGAPQPMVVAAMALDPARETIFWAQSQPPFSLHAAALDGSAQRVLVEAPGAPVTSVALDPANEHLYCIAGVGRLCRVGYDGSDLRELLDISGPAKEQFWQLAVDVDNGQLYWTNDYSIWAAALDGSNARMVVPPYEAPFPLDLVVDGEGGKLYWIDKELGVVRRAKLDGSSPEDLYAVEHPVRGLVLDEITPEMQDVLKKEIYWTAWENRITPQTPGARALWPLDEGQGGQLRDALGRSAPAALHSAGGAAPRWVSDDLPPLVQSPGAVLALDGQTSATLGSAKALGLSSGSFTVECWLKLPADAPESMALIGNDGPYPSALTPPRTRLIRDEYLYLGLLERRAVFLFGVNEGCLGGTALPRGEWLHLAFRFDAAQREQAIFVNGRLDGTRTASHLYLGEEWLQLGRLETTYFTGLVSSLRLWDTARTEAEIVGAMRGYRDSYVIRGAVDGSSRPEHLFEVPSEGGLALVSKLSVEHEQRLLAYRARQAAQEQAARDIERAHEGAAATRAAKQAELASRHDQAATDIAAKVAAHEDERAANRLRLAQGTQSSQRKIEGATGAAAQKRADGQSQAATIQGQANADAARMKGEAQDKRDAARRERDAHR